MIGATQLRVKIISNSRLSRDHFVLTVTASSFFKNVEPGQFLHIRLTDVNEPLLRRPMSIHRISTLQVRPGAQRYALHLLYAVKGKGTALLSKKRSGESLDIIGPLGKGFDYAKEQDKPANYILIAGGMGIAPLSLLADKLTDKRRHTRNLASQHITVLLGATTHTHIFCERHLKKIGCRVYVATEDGSRGFKGMVTDLFAKKIVRDVKKTEKANDTHQSVRAYACGPRAMLNKLTKECIINKIPLQVSLEEFMGCGIGACLGCVIKTTDGYRRVCSDGPVFDARKIVWNF